MVIENGKGKKYISFKDPTKIMISEQVTKFHSRYKEILKMSPQEWDALIEYLH